MKIMSPGLRKACSLIAVGMCVGFGCASSDEAGGNPGEGPSAPLQDPLTGRFSKTFTSDEDFSQGSERGVNHTANPGALQMTTSRATFDTPFLWVANSLDNTVSQIESKTGAITRTVQLVKDGKKCIDPSRTAVNADNDVWVACRGSANMAKVSHETGAVLMIVELEGQPRGIGVDANGKVWVGCCRPGEDLDPIYKIDDKTGECLMGNRAGCQKPPLMVSDWPYGAAVDQKGFLWVVSNGASSHRKSFLTKIDTATDELVGTYTRPSGCAFFYGIAIDQLGDIWTGNFTCDDVLKFDGETGKFIGAYGSGGAATRGVAIDLDGNLWVANSNNSTIAKLNGATGNLLLSLQVGKVVDGATQGQPIGVTVDALGHVWAVNRATDEVIKINGLTHEMQRIKVGNGPYTYSDMMGTLLNSITLRRDSTASWTVHYDTGVTRPVWKEINWKGFTSGNSKIRVRTRCAADKAGLAVVTWSPYGVEPGPFQCPSARWIQLEVQFSTPNKSYTPILDEIALTWEG